jgi:deferrochelatase/peroxidase EfeB
MTFIPYSFYPPTRQELTKNTGAPVAKAIDHDKPELAFDNKFDFRPKKSIKGCPFAAHIRKMRPRADKKRDVGTEDDGDTTPLPEPDSDESEAEGQKENASVILRRGITFGPELTEEEKRQKKTIEHRGIYFTCYQSLIRDGFNLLMTRKFTNYLRSSKIICIDVNQYRLGK